MEKDTFMFGFRFENALGDRLRYYCRENILSLNDLVDRMLHCLAALHDDGEMCLFEKSRFLRRMDQRDKKTTVLTLPANTREMLRNLAFSYRVSMAEVIRLGLEMYLDMVDDRVSKIDTPIHIYRGQKAPFHTVMVFLYPALPTDRIPYPLRI